mmetsp:Transcript_15662/g.17689  ORF Transcript_15662/g.17689 Transcript_15662/m.17689 type:complete len:92 (-) Transcript_15662:540-815(-)
MVKQTSLEKATSLLGDQAKLSIFNLRAPKASTHKPKIQESKKCNPAASIQTSSPVSSTYQANIPLNQDSPPPAVDGNTESKKPVVWIRSRL